MKKSYKGKTLPQLKKILWRWFSLFIRLRDSKEGVGKCISCGKFIEFGANWHAGHYIPKTKGSLYFDEQNVNGQCKACNKFRSGNLISYREGLINKIGEPRVKLLEQRRHNMTPFYRFDLIEKIEKYKRKAKELENES